VENRGAGFIVLRNKQNGERSTGRNAVGSGAQERFGGRFYPHELINSGGMSDIWLVTDLRGKTFAIRKLKPQFRFNLRTRRRFVRGCEVLSQLNESDFIVGYVEHGKMDGTLYLLMDYVAASNFMAKLTVRDLDVRGKRVFCAWITTCRWRKKTARWSSPTRRASWKRCRR
jgi:hypothetical protein